MPGDNAENDEFNQSRTLTYSRQEGLGVKYTNKAHKDIVAGDKINIHGCFVGALIIHSCLEGR